MEGATASVFNPAPTQSARDLSLRAFVLWSQQARPLLPTSSTRFPEIDRARCQDVGSVGPIRGAMPIQLMERSPLQPPRYRRRSASIATNVGSEEASYCPVSASSWLASMMRPEATSMHWD